jgi:hypothetical protein
LLGVYEECIEPPLRPPRNLKSSEVSVIEEKEKEKENEKYSVGYKKPPLDTRFKRGECRNPNGRAGKKRKVPAAPASDADIISMLDQETVEFQGRKISKREVKLRVLHAKACKGDIRAMQVLQSLCEKSANAAAKGGGKGGVLLLPSAVPLDEWEAAAAAQQAQFREQGTDYVDSVVPRPDQEVEQE